MTKHWKYRIPVQDGRIIVEIPAAPPSVTMWKFASDPSDPLAIQVWCRVRPGANPIPYVFRVFGTDWDIPEALEDKLFYLDTVVGEKLVWHLYMEIPE